jgi:uncharacterized delta-60 repeat protein
VVALVRYEIDGTLDASFGSNGKVITSLDTTIYGAPSMAVQHDGKIVVVLTAGIYPDGDFVVIRYSTEGFLDSSFNSNGVEIVSVSNGFDGANAVAVQPDGKIVIAGTSDNGPAYYDFALIRIDTNGLIDSSFGIGGKLTTDFGLTNDEAYSIVIQPDEKIVVSGYSPNDFSGLDFAVVRYNGDGSLDTGFSGDGKLTTKIGSGDDRAYSLVLQPDGKPVVAGISWNGANNGFTAARYKMDGSLDSSFSSDGIVTTDFNGMNDWAKSIALQPDGRIVVAGSSEKETDLEFALSRYHSDGTLDTSFSSDGMQMTEISSFDDHGEAVAMQPDGKIIVAGGANNYGINADFALARYISGLHVGIIDLSSPSNSVFIYPNPIEATATLNYSLKIPETICIHLLDVQGKILKTFIENEKQDAGEHQQEISFPDQLP